MKKVDREWLKKHDACSDGYEYWCENCEGKTNRLQIIILAKYRSDWAYWVLTRLLDTKQNRQLAIFAAQQVLPIFEKKFPKDKRPRRAIRAAIKVIKKDNTCNKAAAYAAYTAACAAAAASTDAAAADAAAYAAYAAAASTDAAAADAAAWAAAADARAAAGDAMKMKIMKYGLTLLEEGLDI